MKKKIRKKSTTLFLSYRKVWLNDPVDRILENSTTRQKWIAAGILTDPRHYVISGNDGILVERQYEELANIDLTLRFSLHLQTRVQPVLESHVDPIWMTVHRVCDVMVDTAVCPYKGVATLTSPPFLLDTCNDPYRYNMHHHRARAWQVLSSQVEWAVHISYRLYRQI